MISIKHYSLLIILSIIVGCTDSYTKIDCSKFEKQIVEKDSIRINQKLNGKWVFVCYYDIVDKIEYYRPNDDRPPIKFNFTNGEIIGQTSTNQVSGKYLISGKNKIHFFRFGGTKVGEIDQWGNEIWDVFRNVTTFDFNENELIIYYNSDSKLAQFIKYYE